MRSAWAVTTMLICAVTNAGPAAAQEQPSNLAICSDEADRFHVDVARREPRLQTGRKRAGDQLTRRVAIAKLDDPNRTTPPTVEGAKQRRQCLRLTQGVSAGLALRRRQRRPWAFLSLNGKWDSEHRQRQHQRPDHAPAPPAPV